MSETHVITVGRQYGSSGRAIARRLADFLGVKFYDKELISMAADRTNLHPDTVAATEQKPVSSWLYTTPGEALNPGYVDIKPINDQVFDAQCQVIKELADKEDCVIVGRCADYVLRDHPFCRNVFVYAPLKARTQMIMERFSLSERDARNLIRRTDKQRRYYYNYYTDGNWGEMENYHVAIDSSLYGIDKTADMLCALFDCMMK